MNRGALCGWAHAWPGGSPQWPWLPMRLVPGMALRTGHLQCCSIHAGLPWPRRVIGVA